MLLMMCFSIIIYNGLICSASAQDRPFENVSSPNPVGSGARALGMGGAFIAVADDATAASWNPGGLIQLRKPEISIVGASFHRIEDNSFSKHPEGNGNQTVSENMRVNYFSAACPFPFLSQNMIVSVNYQHLYDFKREYNFYRNVTDERKTEYDYQSEGNLSAFGIAYAVQLALRESQNLSFGFTLNLWEDGMGHKNKWETRLTERKKENDELKMENLSVDKYSFSGMNVNIGFLWDTGKLKIGGVFKTPFEADLKHEFTEDLLNDVAPPVKSGSEDATLKMPMSYGIGLVYRHSDWLSLSLDVYRTEWDDFIFKNHKGEEFCPITGKPAEDSGIDPTYQVRLGMEYLFIDRVTPKSIVPLCLGLFYDPAPAEGDPDDFFGFTIGSGFSDGEHFTFDIAYQYRFGNNVGTSILGEWGFSQDVHEHKVYSSVIFYFD